MRDLTVLSNSIAVIVLFMYKLKLFSKCLIYFNFDFTIYSLNELDSCLNNKKKIGLLQSLLMWREQI